MTERVRPDDDFIQKIIIKGITTDKTFSVLCTNTFLTDYFRNDSATKIFGLVQTHLDEFKAIPPRDLLVNVLGAEIADYFADVDALDFDIVRNYDYLVAEANQYLKDEAIKKAMVGAVHTIDSNGDLESIRKAIEEALCKDLKVDLGLDYFRELGPRLNRIFSATNTRVPTYFPTFDEYINGGFPPLTLSVIVAKIHGFKSNTLSNFAARQVLHGKNVALLTLEMSQDMFAQRFDAIYSLLDINRMYYGGDSGKLALYRKLKVLKDAPETGKLFIKQYPTGAATVRDFKIYLRELKMRDIPLDIIYVDYINLMKPAVKTGDNLYSTVKAIAEELRALSFEFEVPVVSVSQLNREGSFVGFEDVDFNYISESHGVPATADFMSIFGVSQDALIYESELHNKIVKNRLGGRVGDILKMYYDTRNLKMYDQEEEDLWRTEAAISGDERNFAPPPPETPTRTRRGRSER
jgi:hypothetical protein